MTVERPNIYHYHSKTLEYLLTTIARVNQLDPDNVPVPANATLTPMILEALDNEAVRYRRETDDWEVVADFRGTVYEDADGQFVTIQNLGETVPDFTAGEYSVAAKTAIYGKRMLWLEEKYDTHINGTFRYNNKNYNCNHVEIFAMYLTAQQGVPTDPIPTYSGMVKEGMWETANGFFTDMTNEEFITGLFPAYSENQNRIKTLVLLVKRELEDLLEDTSKTTLDLRLSGREVTWRTDTTYPMPEE